MKPISRFATFDDLDDILALYRELRPQDPVLPRDVSASRWRELLAQPHVRVAVTEGGGSLASTCMIVVVKNLASGGRPFGLIEHVITLERLRGQGLARVTMQYALDFAWSQGCYKAMLLSGAHRTEAHRFYESMGFRGDVERGFVLKR